jgi:CRP-like cAMP-binding protein
MADDKEKFVQQIIQLIPISELTTNAQQEVLNKSNLIKVRKGGMIFKQGDRDEFSYYLLEGEVELLVDNRPHSTLAAGADRARYAMAQLQPRQFSAKATKASTVLQISRDYLDKLMVLHEKDQPDKTNYNLATAEVHVEELSADDGVDWMTRMLQSELFSRMPTANIHALFSLLESVEYKAGEEVIRQGDPGDHYYIIQEGRCQVLRAPPSGGKEIKLAELHAGDSFGEEALITNTTRNATVSMLTPGLLMRLSKDNFIELIKKPTLQRVTLAKAREMVKAGAQWLDVRFKNEHDQSAIENSVNIPLNVLRMQADKLDRNKEYIVYCDTGGRSSTGAFLLAGRGFKVSYLDGGLMNNSDAAKEKSAAPAPAPAPAAAPAVKAPPPAAPAAAPRAAKAGPVVESVEDLAPMDPAVKASVLETELARTDMQLKGMEKRRQEEVYGKDKQKAQAEVEARLKEERAKIEQAKKEAEEEAKRLRQIEEEKLGRMKAEAEKRLQEEKKKLEEVYSRNAEEMEKLQRLKQEAEEQMRRDRERLEKEAAEAKKQLAEAQQLKKQIEASRRAMEKEAQKRLKEQEEMERRIQEKAREKLEAERRKLAEQFARNNEELENAKKERVAADAARQAAKEEAERIIAEYKAKHDEARAVEEARLKAERQKVEAEQKKIQESLREIERARGDAETHRRAALEEVERLRARESDAEITQSRKERESLQAELRHAEERLEHARAEIDAAQEAQEQAEQARKLNEEDLAQRRMLEEELRTRLEQDLEGFKQELAQQEKQFKSIGSQMEHMRRIKDKANAARAAAQQANDNLLSDVASQLDKGAGK